MNEAVDYNSTTSSKPSVDVWRIVGVQQQIGRLSHIHIMHSHMHSYGNGEECAETTGSLVYSTQRGHVPHAARMVSIARAELSYYRFTQPVHAHLSPFYCGLSACLLKMVLQYIEY